MKMVVPFRESADMPMIPWIVTLCRRDHPMMALDHLIERPVAVAPGH
jgi:hypothetical protein